MVHRPSQNNEKQQTEAGGAPFRAPSISLPEGGGAIHGIGEKFAANPVTYTGSIMWQSLPAPVAPVVARSFRLSMTPVLWGVTARLASSPLRRCLVAAADRCAMRYIGLMAGWWQHSSTSKIQHVEHVDAFFEGDNHG